MGHIRRAAGMMSAAGALMVSAMSVSAAADGSNAKPATPPPATSAAPAQPPAETQHLVKFGSWTLSSGSNSNGSTHYVTYVVSATKDLFGFGCDRAGQSGVYSLFLSHTYLAGGSNPKRDLEYVIDRGRLTTAKWEYIEQYAYMRDPDSAREIAGDVALAHTLDVRAFTYELFAVDAHFDVTGAKEAIETLFRDCKG